MTGWVSFAAILMIISGLLDFFQGLIAIIRKEYYTIAGSQVIVFDIRTWGWITLVWGIIVLLAGLRLFAGHGWARWFAIVVTSLGIIEQLGFVGSNSYPLWALAVFLMSVLVLYALIARWGDYQETVGA
jgi:hypothetical protein